MLDGRSRTADQRRVDFVPLPPPDATLGARILLVVEYAPSLPVQAIRAYLWGDCYRLTLLNQW